MGYTAHLRDYSFFISAKNCLKFEKDFGRPIEEYVRDDYYTNLEFDFDVNNNVVGVHYISEKYKTNYEKELKFLIPYVKNGSYLEFFSGDDGTLWRLVFKDNTIKVIEPTIIWDY